MATNLTSGNYQTYDPGHGVRIMQALVPDIILMQEFNNDLNGDRSYSLAEIDALVVSVCGPTCQYTREPGSTGAVIPNGVISKFPILTSGQWTDPGASNRNFVWALIDLPGPRDLWAVSLHLSTNLGQRTQGATALAALLGPNVPAGDLLVVGGDFNTDTEREACIDVLDPLLETAVMPVDNLGSIATSGNRTKPYDRVLPDDDLEVFRVPTVVGSGSYPTGFIFDTRVYTPLSEVPPVQPGDSDPNVAFQMQHMAVLKDFHIPAQ